MPAEIVFNKGFQDNIIVALISDTDFLSVVRGMLPADAFLSPVVRKLVTYIYEYYDSHASAPGDDFHTYFDQLQRNGVFHSSDADVCREYLKEISNRNPNSDYLLSVISNWMKRQSVKGAMLECAPLIERGSEQDLLKAHRLLFDAFEKGAEAMDIGIDLFQYRQPEKDKEADCRFQVNALDKAIRGMNRGELVVFHGVPGIGKTWSLMQCCRAGIFANMNGVIYSGEMTKEQIQGRAAQNFAALTVRSVDETKIWNPRTNDFQMKHKPDSMENITLIHEAFRRAAGFGGSWIVKEFAPEEFTMGDIDSHLTYMERAKGLIMDMVIIDYDEMLTTENHYTEPRHRLIEIYNRMKALAKRRRQIVITATQSNRQGIEAKKVNMSHLSEAFAKAKPSDIMISLNQSEKMYRDGEMDLFVYKNRNGPRYQTIRVSQNFEIGQFALHSERLKAKSIDELDEQSGEASPDSESSNAPTRSA